MESTGSDRLERFQNWRWKMPAALAIILGYILIPTVWGLTNGVILGLTIVPDPGFRAEIASVLSAEDLDKLEGSYFARIPQEKRPVVEPIVHKYLQRVTWLPIHIVSNFIIFVVLGLLVGLTNVQRYWFIIPIVLLPATLTILNAPVVTNWGLTLTVVIVVQMSTLYLTAQFGNWMRSRRRNSRRPTATRR